MTNLAASSCCRIAVLLLALSVSMLRSNTASGTAALAPETATAYAIGGGKLIAFDAQSGRVIKRLSVMPSSGFVSPDLLVDPKTSRLFLLGATVGSTDSPPIEVLSLIDTRTWKVLRTRELPYRLIYKMAGVPIMALSSGGSRLFVYSSDTSAASSSSHPRFWLTVLDARTLKPLRTAIALRGCGPGELATVPGQIVVLCHGADLSFQNRAPSNMLFVNVRHLAVTGRIHLSEQSYGLAVSPNGNYAYVGGFQLAQIDVSRHRVLRDIKLVPGPGLTNASPSMRAFDITPDGSQLVLGRFTGVSGETTGYEIQRYALPGLRAVSPVSLPFLHFVAAPGNELITFSMLDSPGHDWEVAMLDLQTGQFRLLFAMNDPVLQLVVSRPGTG